MPRTLNKDTDRQIMHDQLIDSSFEVKEEDIESYKPLGHWISLDHTGEVSNSTRGSVEL